jgi:hypothetical protein
MTLVPAKIFRLDPEQTKNIFGLMKNVGGITGGDPITDAADPQ